MIATGLLQGEFVSGIDIFLSYSREDRAAARHIAESFTAEGLNVWWDAALQSGQTFDEVIEQRLKEAKAVVVLWSPRSVTSRWVRAEATLADRRNKLVPAIIEACDRPIAFELTHTADLSDWTGDTSDARWRAFVEDVQGMVQKAEAVEEAAPVVAKPQRMSTPPRPAASISPAARERLRPGNDDVIFASTSRRGAPEPPPAIPHAPEPVSVEPEGDEFHCLCVVEEGAEQCFVVSSNGLKIGRSAPADAIIPHPSVSRQHCMVGIANDELLVSDLNSTNGTYIDGQRISGAAVLPVGSILRVGQVSLSHEIRSRAEALQWDSANSRGLHQARLAAAP